MTMGEAASTGPRREARGPVHLGLDVGSVSVKLVAVTS